MNPKSLELMCIFVNRRFGSIQKVIEIGFYFSGVIAHIFTFMRGRTSVYRVYDVGLNYGVSEPPSPSPRSALSPTHQPGNVMHTPRHSHHYPKKNDDGKSNNCKIILRFISYK